ncbi:unnamed protein product, partial [Strongylus vulgaris]
MARLSISKGEGTAETTMSDRGQVLFGEQLSTFGRVLVDAETLNGDGN